MPFTAHHPACTPQTTLRSTSRVGPMSRTALRAGAPARRTAAPPRRPPARWARAPKRPPTASPRSGARAAIGDGPSGWACSATCTRSSGRSEPAMLSAGEADAAQALFVPGDGNDGAYRRGDPDAIAPLGTAAQASGHHRGRSARRDHPGGPGGPRFAGRRSRRLRGSPSAARATRARRASTRADNARAANASPVAIR